MAPTFTIDLEDWHHALHIQRNGHSSVDSVWWLQYKLHQYKVKAIFFVLGRFNTEQPGMVSSIASEGHLIKSHGQDHYKDEEADRKPYSWLGFTGGFYMRFFPYWFWKWQVLRNGLMYVHPHDIDEGHPRLKNPIMNWKRHVGLKGARRKLERLLKEVEFADPSKN